MQAIASSRGTRSGPLSSRQSLVPSAAVPMQNAGINS